MQIKKMISEIIDGFIWCFLVSCGATVIINFSDIINSSDISEIATYITIKEFIHVFITLATLIILNRTNILPIPGMHVQLPASCGRAYRVENLSDEKHNLIAEYNTKINITHEAGHALMLHLKDIDFFNVHVSDISSKAVVVYKNWNGQDIKDQILITYAGAAAEELMLDEFHYGCIGTSKDSDFFKATDLIKAYIVMQDASKSKSLLEAELSNEIIKLSKEFYQESKQTLLKHKDQLNFVMEALKNNNYLTKTEVEELLKSDKKNNI